MSSFPDSANDYPPIDAPQAEKFDFGAYARDRNHELIAREATALVARMANTLATMSVSQAWGPMVDRVNHARRPWQLTIDAMHLSALFNAAHVDPAKLSKLLLDNHPATIIRAAGHLAASRMATERAMAANLMATLTHADAPPLIRRLHSVYSGLRPLAAPA